MDKSFEMHFEMHWNHIYLSMASQWLQFALGVWMHSESSVNVFTVSVFTVDVGNILWIGYELHMNILISVCKSATCVLVYY